MPNPGKDIKSRHLAALVAFSVTGCSHALPTPLYLQCRVNADPPYVDQVNGNLRLRSGGPAINAGTASYTHLGHQVLACPPGSYAVPAPDLGARETAAPP